MGFCLLLSFQVFVVFFSRLKYLISLETDLSFFLSYSQRKDLYTMILRESIPESHPATMGLVVTTADFESSLGATSNTVVRFFGIY